MISPSATSGVLARRTFRLALLYTLTLGLSSTATSQSISLDERRAVGFMQQVWSSSLTLIRVPVSRQRDGQTRHFTEHCSAVAVTPSPDALYLSAWHCFDGYDSSLGQIEMVLRGDERAQIMPMTLLASGGSMTEDWAILRAIDTHYAPPNWIPVLTHPLSAHQPLMAAGFAALPANDNSDGARRLLFDPDCSLAVSADRPHATNCAARKGSSGGAVLTMTSSGSPRLVGIISAGDGSSLSFYYPALFLADRISALR